MLGTYSEMGSKTVNTIRGTEGNDSAILHSFFGLSFDRHSSGDSQSVFNDRIPCG